MTMSIARVSPGSAYRYYFKSVAVGDGTRKRGTPLPVGQEAAGVPAGEWTGRGARLLGLSGVVTEAEMEALFGKGLHPHPELLTPGVLGGEAPAVRLGRAFIRPTYVDGEDQEPGEPEAVVPDDDGKTRSARRRRMKRGPVAAFDLVLRPPVSVSLLRALGDDTTVAVMDASHDVAVADVLAWLEDEAVVVYSGPGGTTWERPVGGLVVARFRHWDSRHRMPLLHDHLVVSVKVLRADGTWGHLDSRRLLAHVVAAGALYNQRVLEEVCERLGLATEPRTPTPGLRPVMEIAGVPPELIAWTAIRQRDTAVLLEQAEADYVADHGYPPTARVRSRLMKRAADDSRPAKKTPLPLSELRRRWRADAIRRFGTELMDGLLELCRRAAAAIRAARPTQADTGPGVVDRVDGVDVILAAVAAAVYIHHGDFRHRHLLAEARRHLARELRGRRAEPGLESRIVTAAIRGHCVDITPPRVEGRRPRPPGHTVYTATWHSAPPREDAAQRPQDTAVELSCARAGGGQHPPPGPPAGLQDSHSRSPAGPVRTARQAFADRPGDRRGAVRAVGVRRRRRCPGGPGRRLAAGVRHQPGAAGVAARTPAPGRRARAGGPEEEAPPRRDRGDTAAAAGIPTTRLSLELCGESWEKSCGMASLSTGRLTSTRYWIACGDAGGCSACGHGRLRYVRADTLGVQQPRLGADHRDLPGRCRTLRAAGDGASGALGSAEAGVHQRCSQCRSGVGAPSATPGGASPVHVPGSVQRH
jgi:conjugative relaxase-like TrwC/TraI family protein